MKPRREKAKELIDKFYKYAHDGSNGGHYDTRIWTENAKQCALIAVDEILNTIEQIFETFEERKYWQEVKQEINNL